MDTDQTGFRSQTPRLDRVPFTNTTIEKGSVHKHHDWTGFRSQTTRLKRVPFTNTTIGQGSVQMDTIQTGFRSYYDATKSMKGSTHDRDQTPSLPSQNRNPKDTRVHHHLRHRKKNLSWCLLHRTPLPRTVVGQFRYPHLYTIILTRTIAMCPTPMNCVTLMPLITPHVI